MDQISDWETSSNVETAPPSVPETPAAPVPPVGTEPVKELTPEAAAAPEKSDEPQDDQFERDAKGRIRRHRARSQMAGPEDVPRIAELTRRLRETEAKLAEITTKPAENKAQGPSLPAVPEMPGALSPFTQPEPKLEDFSDKDDPYAEWMLARAEWRVDKKQFEGQQKALQAQTAQAQQQMAASWQQIFTQHDQRIQEYATKNPDYLTRLNAAPGRELKATPVLHAALMLSPDGPAKTLYLAEHPDELSEILLQTYQMPVSPDTVAIVQRRLSSRVQAGTTGSVASAPVTLAPRPPNPVRTAPSTPPDVLPGDDASLEEHEKVWGRKRRRA